MSSSTHFFISKLFSWFHNNQFNSEITTWGLLYQKQLCDAVRSAASLQIFENVLSSTYNSLTQNKMLQLSQIGDQREEQDILQQEHMIDKLTQKNIKNFKIKLTTKKKVIYLPSDRTEISLDDGWFCTITDNNVCSKRVVMTSHGCPGDERDWAGIETEMRNYCRWINLVLPGFDGKDQRRGDYRGNIDDVIQLILRVMNKLGIQKIIGCGYSMGTVVWIQFMHKHPDRIEGFVNIAGLVDSWYLVLMAAYRSAVSALGFDKTDVDVYKLSLDEDFREKANQRTNYQIKQFHFGDMALYPMKTCETFGISKLFSSVEGGLSHSIKRNKKLNQGCLKTYLFAKTDTFVEHRLSENMMYRRVYGDMQPDKQPNFSERFKLVKQDIKKICYQKHNVEIDVENIQSNFCFLFPDTTHNVHTRRPQQAARVIRVYLTVLDQMQRAQILLKSRL